MSPRHLRTAVASTAVLAAAGLATQLPAIAATTKPATRRVTVADRGYTPKKLTVSKGTKVTWAFAGSRGHNVTVDTGPTSFASPTKSSGTFTKTLKKPGSYVLYCSIHNFEMTVKVK